MPVNTCSNMVFLRKKVCAATISSPKIATCKLLRVVPHKDFTVFLMQHDDPKDKSLPLATKTMSNKRELNGSIARMNTAQDYKGNNPSDRGNIVCYEYRLQIKRQNNQRNS